MESRGKRFVVIGGAGLIGSHTVDLLTKRDVAEIVIYDNFVRGSVENLAGALRDPRVKIFEAGGDITQPDILDAALRGADGVFHFAALWLLQCHEYPRSAFEMLNVFWTDFLAGLDARRPNYTSARSTAVTASIIEQLYAMGLSPVPSAMHAR